jgi:hypothetical protein
MMTAVLDPISHRTTVPISLILIRRGEPAVGMILPVESNPWWWPVPFATTLLPELPVLGVSRKTLSYAALFTSYTLRSSWAP